MCDKTILQNGGILRSVPDCYTNQEMRSKAVDNYPHALELVPEYYKTQKMCDKAVDTYTSTIRFVPACFMAQKMYHKSVNRRLLVFHSVLDQ